VKIARASDIHLEFGPITLDNTEGADVLVLAGDICVAKDLMKKDNNDILDRFGRSEKWHQFFQECSDRFPNVIYIMGNHEHYHGDYANTVTILRDRLGYLANLYILDKEMVELGGVSFIGGTLWTDMNKEDAITLLHMKGMMNDFRCVKNSKNVVTYKIFDENNNAQFKTRAAMFTPEDAVVDHRAMLEYIRLMIEGKFDQKFVVVGHHSPSKASTHPRYADEQIMNGGYSSDLSEFILDHPQIKLWTHGHTHHKFDYMIGSTRIVCNPRGYIHYEPEADNFELQFIEV
jgi:Icc-related predicted phosphoesterase